jgi:hypothetical protein
MRVVSRVLLALVLISLAAATMGRADAPPPGRQAPGLSQAPPTPHIRVGGRISRRESKPFQGIVRLSAFVPGARTAATSFDLKVDKSSLLLNADDDGRMTQIAVDDLYEANTLDEVRAVVAREADPKDASHLIHWLVLYPRGRGVPPPWPAKEPDTTY